jgi:uncharacterized membrane protein
VKITAVREDEQQSKASVQKGSGTVASNSHRPEGEVWKVVLLGPFPFIFGCCMTVSGK